MSRLSSALRSLMLLAAMAAGMGWVHATESHAEGNRTWVAMLIEDHAGMREMVWDAAFTNPDVAGPFKKDHRYAILTKGPAGLVDMGCWDEAWASGGGGRAPALVMRVSLTRDGSGAILTSGGKSTWLPVAFPYTGRGIPTATLRGAYLNWLLASRGTTPGIPRETRWQRLRRGAEAVVRDLLTRSGDRPEYRVVGIGTSGRLLIPPGEGLSAGLNAVARMEPSDSGCMLGSLNQALDTAWKLRASGVCTPGIVLPMGDGWALHRPGGSGEDREHSDDRDHSGDREHSDDRDHSSDRDGSGLHQTCGQADAQGHSTGRAHEHSRDDDDASHKSTCGTAVAYESSSDYASMLAMVRAIRDTGEAEVWAWSVEGARTWSKDFAANGAGLPFSGDAVAGLDAALKAWTGRQGQPLQITLTFDQPALTRVAQATLTLRSNHGLKSGTLNGQIVQITGLDTKIPLTLNEGNNTFSVSVTDLCGSQAQASAAITLDTTPPRITLNPAPPALTNQTALTLRGRVDDPTATLTLNGQPVALDPQGAFAASVPLQEGPNAFALVATDISGNTGRLDASVVRDTVAPVVTFATPLEGLVTNAAIPSVSGQVNDPAATFTVNGQAVPLTPNGAFAFTIAPPEGPLTLIGLATDAAGNVGRGERHIVIDRTAPRITLTRPVPALVAVTSLSLQGVVDDPAARLTFNGAAVAVDAQGAFTVEAALSEGANTFHFEAVDLAGNVGVLDAKTVRDTTPPVVTLDSPPDGFITNQRSLLVKGRVDDPTARLLVAGQSLSPAADGGFEVTLTPSEGAQLIVALATDPAGNTGHAVRSVTLDWTPPVLTWATPTPAEGAKITAIPVPVVATVSESAAVQLNGQSLTLESGVPFLAKTTLSPAEGAVTLSLEATDRAGNTTRIERHFDLGLTAPKVVIESPAEGLQTQDGGAVLVGHVESGDFLKPVTLSQNGVPVPLGADGRFSLPVQLVEGANLFTFVATNAFGLQGQATRALNRFTTPFGVQIDWPLDGLAIPETSVEVRGRVRRAGTTVAVNGIPASVEPSTLVFTVVVPLQPGLNPITAAATDGAGNQGKAQVKVTCAPPADPAATYRWDLPVNASSSRTRMVHVQGQADLPGVTSVKVNGLPMSLSGIGKDGTFEGEVPLEAKGRNVLFLEARTLAGATLTERREVRFVPDLPRIRLQAPETARPGDAIPIQVSPESGTKLMGADISWNGRFLAKVSDPFAAVTAQVPGDAAVGSRILVEALATDVEGEQVTARTYVTVYGLGALLVEAYDDQQGLPLKEGLAAVEGGEAQSLNATGKAALRTALPQNWIKVSRSGYTPVWRPAGLQVGGVMAAVDARLTPLAAGQTASAAAFTGGFGKGALDLSFPTGAFTADVQVSGTPLSTQGLPGLLPAGWSAISAWWVDLGAFLATAGTAALTLPGGAPQDNLTWVRWDEALHTWVTLTTGLRASDLTGLPIPAPGGFALVVPDSGATAPPAAIPSAQLPAFEGPAWRDGLVANGTVDPAILPTTAAIRGVRAMAKFNLGFDGKDPLPSGALIQVDVLESYALLDSALIEPDGFTQDAVLARWILGVDKDGTPTLKAAQDLGLELPVRMSRTFLENELVDGRIWVGFYHDGIQLVQSGSELLDASGGVISHDGIQLTVPAQALAGTTLFRLNADLGELTPLWPELAGQGTLAKSFQLDIVGNVQRGLQLRFDDLGQVPQGILPLLLQRRVVEGERVLVTVGELNAANGGWVLRTPGGGSPLTTSGSFAVLVPGQAWGWISGQATVPGSVAQPLVQRLGAKARLLPVRQAKTRVGAKARSLASDPGDHAVADAMVEAGYLKAVSGSDGSFAVPAYWSPNSVPVTVRGERRDLGVRGSVDAPVPSAGQVLRLAQVPFQVMTIAPAELAEVSVGTIVEVLLSTAADPATVGQVKVYQEVPALVEVAMRRTLSQDGRTLLLTPEAPLQAGAVYRVVTLGLASVSGEIAPATTRRFRTQSQPQFPGVDLTRIKLSYPTDAFDVTVTIPEGAVPPWSIVEIEAPGMGSYASGVMPPRGDLVFPLKATLGERLKVTVQLMDGRSLQGTISRYVADDGRTTVGADGGRVEGPGGLAITVPAGALDTASELRVVVSTERPQPPEGALVNGEQMAAALELRSKDPISFKKPPILELPLSAVPAGMMTTVDPSATFGNGPVPVYQKVVTKLPDGTDDFSYVLMDTAQLSSDGQKLRSAGGLLLTDPVLGSARQAQPVRLTSRSLVPEQAKTQAPGTLVAPRLAGSADGSRPLASISYEPYSVGFFTMYFPVAVIEPQYLYTSGTVYRNWNGSGACGGTASAGCYGELASAEVHRYNGTTGLDAARKGRLARGRMLTTCDSHGRYLNVGGPGAGNVVPGQSWIALFAVDPRTGETSIDPNSPSAPDLGLPSTRREHSIAITSQGGNPFDPALTAPRIRAVAVDGSGVARTMFTVGETATMRITTETGSQPVVRGKVSGSLTQDFGTLPADILVSFTLEGTWKADILGWTAKPVQGAASLSVVVTPVGVLGPNLPGKPTILSRNPSDGDKDVDPSTVIKITFSEPVRGATSSAFSLEVNTVKVPFKVISNAREVVDATTLVQEVWLMPDQRLSLGGKVTVTLVSSLIMDQDAMSPDPASWSFTVRGADEVGSLADVGTFSQMVVHKGKIYAAEDVGTGYYFDGTTFQVDAGMRKQGVRVIDATDPSNPRKSPIFGEYRSWDPPSPEHLNLSLAQGPFAKSSISGLRVATGVNIGGRTRDVLLVATRPWSAQEIIYLGFIAADEYYPTVYRIRHSALWAFDITDDADATEVSMGNTIPKLLMATSQGTMSENWVKGLGGAGGVLGSIKLRGGMTMWDASQWQGSWEQDKATLSDWTIRYRTAGGTGYYPDPQSLVASNGFYDASGNAQPSVTSAVVTDDANGRPIGFATMGYSTGYLIAIDGKVGDPMAMATYSGGGPYGMDGRLHDLSTAVNRETANAVEVLKGNWQGPSGSEQGTLLLVGTTAGTGAHFWVLKPDLADMNNPSAAPYALATLPAKITRILPDPARMLVGVEAGGRAYIFDLKNIQPSVNIQGTTSMTLTPIYDFAVSGAWTVQNGFLFSTEGTETRKLEIKNIDGAELEMFVGAPIVVDMAIAEGGTEAQFDSAPVAPTIVAAPKANSVAKPMAAAFGAARYVYAMAATQGKNGGYPWLRYCYPELGPMQMSAVIQPKGDLYKIDLGDKNKAKVVAQIAPYLNGTFLGESGLKVTALDVKDDQVTPLGTSEAWLKTDKELTRLPLITGEGSFGRRDETNTTYANYYFAPFQIESGSLSSTLQDAIRQDLKGSYRIKVRFTLWLKEGGLWTEKTDVFKELEYAVKYNANTTLYDVARGGVWHYNPDLSGGDPALVRFSPATKNIEEGTTSDAVALRDKLSITIGAATTRDFFDHNKAPLAGQKLDAIQAYLRNIVGAMRYKVGLDNSLEQLPPVDMNLVRPTEDGTSIMSSNVEDPVLGDATGAFGIRTLRMVHAIQSYSNIENENAGKRDIRQPQTWAVDPFNGEGKILPALNQKLMSGPYFRADAAYFHYVAMYPSARKNAQTPEANLAPMNALITSDLVFGPSFTQAGDSVIFTNNVSKDSEKSSVTTTLAEQRKNIDGALIRLRQLPTFDPADPKVQSIFGELEGYLTHQDLIVYKPGVISGRWGNIFNPGIGILQLAYSSNHKGWLANLRDTKKIPAYLAPGIDLVARNPADPNGYDDNQPDEGLYNQINVWLLNSKASISPRLDVYVNGVWNTERALQESVVAFQGTIRNKEDNPNQDPPNPDPASPGFPYPVLGVLNRTGSLLGLGDVDVPVVSHLLDGLETAWEKYTTPTNPRVKITDRDSQRLIVTLKALVQALYQPEFRDVHHADQKDKMLPGRVWDLSGSTPQDLGLVAFLQKKPEDADTFQLVPKTQNNFDDEFPLADPNRLAHMEAAKSAMRVLLKTEILRLDARLDNFRKEGLTLHAHSQGSLKVAAAHTRLGVVNEDRKDSTSNTIPVANYFHVVTYGGAADMFDYGTGRDPSGNYVGMDSYEHHVNLTDPVTLMGMQRPFLFGTATLPVGRMGLFLPWLIRKTGTLDLPGYLNNLEQAAKEHHRVILHGKAGLEVLGIGMKTAHPVIPNYVCYVESLKKRKDFSLIPEFTRDGDVSWLWRTPVLKCP